MITTHNQIDKAGALVLEKVSQRHDCTPEEMVGPTKPDRIAVPRHMAFWLLRVQGYKFTQIAELFNRTHAAVLHGCLAVNNLFDIDPNWRKQWPEYTEFRVASKEYTPNFVEDNEAWL